MRSLLHDTLVSLFRTELIVLDNQLHDIVCEPAFCLPLGYDGLRGCSFQRNVCLYETLFKRFQLLVDDLLAGDLFSIMESL